MVASYLMVSVIDQGEALHHVHGIAVKMAGHVEDAFVIVIGDIDHQRVAFPVRRVNRPSRPR